MIIIYKIKELPETERPRERLKEVGPNYLSDKEILAIILKTGTKDKNVMDLSLEILKQFNLTEFKDFTINKLTTIKGIGEVKAIELLAVIELGRRIFQPTQIKKILFKDPKSIFLAMRNTLLEKKQECFYALYLNNKHYLIEKKLLFIGTINESIVHPREIFKAAYLLSATYIIVIHNHPSNDTTPSSADIDFTEKLIEIGHIQGIPITDHIIIGNNNYYSFYEKKQTYIKELS